MFLTPEKDFPWELIGGQDEPLFEAFKKSLEDMGLPCPLVVAENRKNSCYAARRHTVPVLRLYAVSSEVYRRFIGDPPRMGLLAEDTAATVRQIWRELCGQYGCDIKACCDNDMYVFLSNIQADVFTRVLREHKQELERFVTERLQMPVKYFFVSSQPACNIIFASKEDYRRAEALFGKAEAGLRETAEVYARQMLKNVPTEKEILKINFWHPDMPGYNGYGLSRED